CRPPARVAVGLHGARQRTGPRRADVSQPSEPSEQPGAAGAVLRHVVVGKDANPADAGAGAGIAEVVRLILEHARTRPGESLGVITLGVRHAERVDAALRAALAAASAPAPA